MEDREGCLAFFVLTLGCHFSHWFIMILSLNVRGTWSKTLPFLIRNLKAKYGAKILIISEPAHISGKVAKLVLKKLPFNKFVVEASGFLGGIWLLWNDDGFAIKILNSYPEVINAKIIPCDSSKPWVLFVVYGLSRLAERQVLWERLSLFS